MQPNPYLFNNQGLGGQEEIAEEVVPLAYVPQAALSALYAVIDLSRTDVIHSIPFTTKGRRHGKIMLTQVCVYLEINANIDIFFL